MPTGKDEVQNPPARSRLNEEVVSDSEEERIKSKRNVQVIVISSESDSGEEEEEDQASESEAADDALAKGAPGPSLLGGKDSGSTPHSDDRHPRPNSQLKIPQKTRLDTQKTEGLRHIGIIELSDGEEQVPPHKPSSSKPPEQPGEFTEQTAISHRGFDDWLNDGSILILDEPRSARKPKRINSGRSTDAPPTKKGSGPFVLHISGTAVPSTDSQKDPFETPLRRPPKVSMTNVASQAKPRRTPGKKALAAAEQERRVAYAQELFLELNQAVFQNGLPSDTKLVWSKRLLTTAGRARWHRSRTGEQTSSIELAEKILDCDERIRNTLSHEMCHLASWVIDQAPGENHGSIWKGWARKVMKARPEIEISTRHDYEIVYKYQWRCEKCTKIYGRHSKSIKSEEVVCGFCREGQLIPLFTTRQPKTPQTPKVSLHAASKSQDSPRSLPRLTGVGKRLYASPAVLHHGAASEHSDTDPDPVLNLTKALSSITVSGGHSH